MERGGVFYGVGVAIDGFQTGEAEVGWDGILLDALNEGGNMGCIRFPMRVPELSLNL